MDKKALRKLMLAERCQFEVEEVDNLSVKICEQYFAGFAPQKQPQVIHVFLPIRKNREINTWLIIEKLWRDFPDSKVVVPVTNFQAQELEHYQILPGTEIIENHWGIPEPVNAQRVSEAEIDTVLMPLLAFDAHGNRIGYGKGFYDQFLQHCKRSVLKIGLSLLPPVPHQIPADAWDVPLDHCLTPEKRYDFGLKK
ncbi:5-formyltetrahydrofolate cyclo-ligase [Adhaeribacter sp. BT258]|uniref:5-formyltetrahydrofolate cyclo-ligase n=1 Tax=Adhaeribacter terrigena TaxID=2793070 RepID=A0ABS1C1R3_9BACT|nr:5-formyltetrahydrofolate cyclo-ligase [Adhaeribacter terrigena]MBK0403283.1 5-formyltetrahydrofolate cyclo-ligase [Adhaeribacter terrigena]